MEWVPPTETIQVGHAHPADSSKLSPLAIALERLALAGYDANFRNSMDMPVELRSIMDNGVGQPMRGFLRDERQMSNVRQLSLKF